MREHQLGLLGSRSSKGSSITLHRLWCPSKKSLPLLVVSRPLLQHQLTFGPSWYVLLQFIQLGCSVVSVSATPWIAARQASRSSTNSRSSLRLMSIESLRPSSHLILCHPLLLLPQSLPASESFPMSQLSAWGGQSTWVSALASFLPRNPRADLLQNGVVGSPCSPRDSQESSPTLQFKSINSSALSFIHSPTLTTIYDHWKNHSLDYMDLCWQSNGSAFQYAI